MPELPEVETVRRGLVPVLRGHTIAKVSIVDPRLTQPVAPQPIADDLVGRRVVELERLGKYLLLVLDNDMVLEHHLRMTGSFGVYAPGASVTHQHVRLTYTTDDGARVVYNDPRRFGTLRYETRGVTMERLARTLGVEPLSEQFTATVLARLLATSRAPIKALLLNQKLVAGLGNIYVDEALFLARIHPLTPGNAVSRARTCQLREAIVSRLTEAIEVGGSTLRDYRNVAGEAGGMQERFVAYGRGGAPCLRCGRPMRSARVAGRGTTWCANCQRQARTSTS
ncbi:MAG: bifunctional DNA-formamidopyrimidine glycosylase/DNA-(apurinic or apyrimidinic site) lyase [Thermoleophilia bacterium]|nr:bifunctional DNA-formamidopyrimidine glycosylase/DNA-(apurinic or apyrimidinic site) lyase [Thermoleophilia bacterium]